MYFTSRGGVLFTSRGGTLHVERGGTIHIHVEREYYSRVLFMSRGGTLHVERGYSSRREGVLFTSRGAVHVKRGAWQHNCM